MALITKLKVALGLRQPRSDDAGTTVTVEPGTTPVDPPDEATELARTSADRSEPMSTRQADGEDRPVQAIDGIGPTYGERLAETGIETVGDLVTADLTALARQTGIGVGRLSTWVEQANDS